MITWRLSKTFTLSEAALWEALSNSLIGVDVHADRKKGFILSREALRLALNEIGEDPLISDLVVSEYRNLNKYPNLLCSLSHSKTAGAAVIGSRLDYKAIGIDIEQEERVVKQSIIERISHQNDLILRNIELWCLKEAAFKCLMNTGKFGKPFEFSEIEILKGRFKHAPSKLEGAWELTTFEQHVVAIATLEA